jgi:hypothetical protein
MLYQIVRAQEFRDNLLQRYPYLLDQFLQQTIEDNKPGVSNPEQVIQPMLNGFA